MLSMWIVINIDMPVTKNTCHSCSCWSYPLQERACSAMPNNRITMFIVPLSPAHCWNNKAGYVRFGDLQYLVAQYTHDALILWNAKNWQAQWSWWPRSTSHPKSVSALWDHFSLLQARKLWTADVVLHVSHDTLSVYLQRLVCFEIGALGLD